MNLYKMILNGIKALPENEGLSTVSVLNRVGEVCAIGAGIYGHIPKKQRNTKSHTKYYLSKAKVLWGKEAPNSLMINPIWRKNDSFSGSPLQRKQHMIKYLENLIAAQKRHSK